MDQNQNTNTPSMRGDNFLDKAKAFFARHNTKPPAKRLAIVVGISLAVLIGGSAASFAFIKDTSEVVPAIIPEKKPEPPKKTYSPLTGIETSEENANRRVTGVMIENSIDARPQAGLDEAGVVFEAIAEGGITRFLALFQEARPGKIGPIRSARPYYVRWAKGFDAGYAHSGGSGEALALIPALGVKDLDHGKNSSYFDRVSNRFAPHNVYTSMDRLDQYATAQGYGGSEFKPFERISADEKVKKNETASANEKANAISFDISSARYNTSYSYDAAAKAYNRVMSGQPHVDEATGKQITPEVVVALYTDYSINPNGIHSVYRVTGTGEADVFQNGEMIKAMWRKTDDAASLEFLTADGQKPLPLVRGQTWITALPKGRVSYSP